MVVEDVIRSDEEEDFRSKKEYDIRNFSTNPAIQAVFEISKAERKELGDVKARMMKMQNKD